MPVKLFRVNVSGDVPKDRTLEDIGSLIKVEELGINYEKYMEPALLWATEDLDKTAMILGLEKIVPKGAYLMGLFGGEKKKGKQEYAGIVIERYEEHDGVVFIKLVNLSKAYQVPVELMRRYGVGVYKLYYVGLINPFKCLTHRVLLSAIEERLLRDFLRMFIEVNRGSMVEEDIRRLNALAKELRTSLDLFEEGSYYVVYRRSRAFTACVPEDLRMAVSHDDISYLKCKSLEQAYYYAAVLNYLAYKVVETGRSFIRHQFARPAMAIAAAGLSWQEVSEKVKDEVRSLSAQLSRRLNWREYSNQKVALREVAKTSEFARIESILDGLVNRERLRAALELVSATGVKEEPED